jgi:RIO-like serine/threonine protein kinase
MLSEDGLRPIIIDWPQFVTITHPGAKDILYRDLVNTFGFFEKRFHTKMPDLEEYTSRIPK